MKEFLQQKQQEEEELKQLIQHDKIVLCDLPMVAPHIRKTLLSWIAKAMTREDRTVKTEIGWKMKVVQKDDSLIELHAEDGTMIMPNYEIHFLESREGISSGA
jgi:precorrin isomerase